MVMNPKVQSKKWWVCMSSLNYRVLKGGVPRGGGNWGTLGIPREDWGALGNIRETPPLGPPP